MLSGLGADEAFGGYDRYLDYFFRQRRFALRWAAGGIDWFDALLHLDESESLLFPGMASFFDARQLKRSLRSPFDEMEFGDADRAFYRDCRALKKDAHLFEMMVAHECRHRIPDLLLANFETVARGTGVNVMYPYLDAALVSAASALRPADRYWYEGGSWWAKRLLREIAAEWLPDSIIMRPRAIYTAPIAEWLREPSFGPEIVERFAESAVWNAGLLRRPLRGTLLRHVRNIQRSENPTRRAWLEQFWIVLTLGAWYDTFVASS